MGLYGWLNIFIKKTEEISIDPNRCMRIRSPLSKCFSCTDHCPTDGIKFKNGLIEIETCLSCGICTTVCPTNALKWNAPPLVQYIDKVKNKKNEKQIYLCCDKTIFSWQQLPHVQFNCLALISWEMWLHFLTNQIAIFLPNCTSCQITTGEKIWKSQLEKAEIISNKKILIIDHINIQSTEEIDQKRRNLLYNFTQNIQQTNQIAIKNYAKIEQQLSPQEKYEKYHSPTEMDELKIYKRNMVEKLIDEKFDCTDKRGILLEYEDLSEIPIDLPVIDKYCDNCGACVFLCPTDAMKMTTNIEINPIKCVQCHLCEEVCWEKRITFQSFTGALQKEK